MTTETKIEFWFRYEEQWYAGAYDYERDVTVGSSKPQIQLRKYQVLRHTPKGVWLKTDPFFYFDIHRDQVYKFEDVAREDRRFVLRDANKRWAAPSIAEAKKSFIERKNRQLQILLNKAMGVAQVLEAFDRDVLEDRYFQKSLSAYYDIWGRGNEARLKMGAKMETL